MSYARVHRQQNPNPSQRDRNDMHVFITNFQTTCEIQHRIGVKVIERVVAGGGYDFDRRWVEASLEERRKHVLVGLVNGVKLLEDVTPQNMSLVPKEPYYIPSEAWDGAKAAQERDSSTSEQARFDLMEMIILRTKLIYLVVEGSGSSTCRREEAGSGEDEAEDWKARHEHICGRSISSVGEAMQMSQSRSTVSGTNVSQFGPAKNGFKRTPQPITHMRYLDLNPDTDFFAYVDPEGGPRSLFVRHPLVRKVFRAARERAMVDGSKEAAAESLFDLGLPSQVDGRAV
ncbi:hypothetical protein BC629DRAFT_1599958 [Irpex lacteus]|nr:hypothetical protein BC629DRAFT_1599958 [Irpex lacteus]